ncbi:uncharacterized protein N7515_002139 [Penicillium bovifimosum]|uniref:Aminoglycoside phosphotransferase domain-containing protein n=1 Tax=Penicillium bovifimosum TaxID=126998 RepID=A0A9W9HB01_9EURO|nr:uncharacterized protein N7515_002139 [Penicillium bovifimosum]KAJ5143352.1 hypothetical protein N7515_002139 [Penicillium bovifimosum]
MIKLYNLDDTIDSFFASNPSVTRQQCDDFVRSHATDPSDQVIPVQIQGAFSYTVTAGSKLFQFRVEDSRIDQEIMTLAKAAHPEFVAVVNYHETIGTEQPLHIYEMEKLPGIPYILARDVSPIQPPESISRQQNTTRDFARFFAQSWNKRQPIQGDVTKALHAEFDQKFNVLAQILPPRFKSRLVSIRRDLLSLFSGALPFVLTHGDLCEMNILIDPESGKLTGIVDWAEARILPFGFSLWGFENVLGFMNSKGWHYYDNRRELESLFWKIFREEAEVFADDDLILIQRARAAGLFCRYGFISDGLGVNSVVGQPSPSSLAYLDGICTTTDQCPGELDKNV